MEGTLENTRGRALTALAAVAISVATAFAAVQSVAFDGEDWFGKREILAREAERLSAAFTNCVAKLRDPAIDVAIPVETFEDGSVKTSIKAARAQFFVETGLVWAEGVEVSQFDERGTLVTKIEAERCVVDRESKSGWAPGRAKAEYGKTVVEGENVYFSFPEQYVMIFSRAGVSSTDIKLKGVKL